MEWLRIGLPLTAGAAAVRIGVRITLRTSPACGVVCVRVNAGRSAVAADRTPSAATESRRLRYVLECVADGRMDVSDARRRLRGIPTEPGTAARWLKDGRWASEGGLPTGVQGARIAAREALRGLA